MCDFLEEEQASKYLSLDSENEIGHSLAELIPSEVIGPMEAAERQALSEKVVSAVGRLPHTMSAWF
jgi:hypothetical protein